MRSRGDLHARHSRYAVCVRRICVIAGCLAASSVGTARGAPSREAVEEVHPGIVRERWRDAAVPTVLHVVRVDLTSAEVGLYATREDQRGRTTSSFASLIGAQIAVNGDLFAVASYLPRGLAWGEMPWASTADDARSALFHLRRVGERTLAAIEMPEMVNDVASLPAGTQGAIGGRPLLVRSGAINSDLACDDAATVGCGRAPRTALALSTDGNVMWIVVADGWQQSSLGVTATELAAFARNLGAHHAIALDGGAAATLVIGGAVANSPSDGVERSVANHLAIKYGALPRGQLVGVICRDDIFTCPERLAGAEVTLDDGRVQTVGADAFYNFTNVTPRLACVTVRKPGYRTARKCATVGSGQEEYNSVALVAGMDLPDAGVPDAGFPDDDAGVPGDAGEGATGDAGVGGGGGGGGCCDVGTRDPPGATAPLLVVFVAWRLGRRRGTTGPG